MSGIPEWVHVWGWLRQQGFDSPLPQQEAYVRPGTAISVEDYELALKSWIEAGKPPVWKTYGIGRNSPDELKQEAPELAKSIDALLGV